jgi:CHASE3 domain
MQLAAPRFPVQPILLAVGFVLLVGIGMSTLWLARQSSEDASSVSRTVSVQEKLSTLLLNVRRAESSQRGYLLTGRQAYLLDYSAAAPTVETFWPSCALYWRESGARANSRPDGRARKSKDGRTAENNRPPQRG